MNEIIAQIIFSIFFGTLIFCIIGSYLKVLELEKLIKELKNDKKYY